MDKNRIRKTIAILLAVLFLVTVTAGAVSASSSISGKKPSQESAVSAIDRSGKPADNPILIKEKKLASLEVTKDKKQQLFVANTGSYDTYRITTMAVAAAFTADKISGKVRIDTYRITNMAVPRDRIIM